MNPIIKTKIPGPKSKIILNKLKKLNLAYSGTYPFVHSKKGQGCYFQDIDNNWFLDFGSQISSLPLGYNHPELNKIINKKKQHPVKYAGQDFTIEEHLKLIEELTTITPKNLNSAFLVNSGAEAVENCLKIALKQKHKARFGISFKNSFHGRTLGALSCTASKKVQKKNFFTIPVKHIAYDESSIEKLNSVIKVHDSKKIGFVIIEAIQGEGGYNVAPKNLLKKLRIITKTNNIPLILDEVQSGLARTGKWWAHQHFNIQPDVMSSAKALQVGAAITNKSWSPEQGSISSTWGGGHVIDLAVGLKTIQIIKKNKLLSNINKQGNYLIKNLKQLEITNIRGKGLMLAFDLNSKDERNNFVIECLKQGLVILGCGNQGVRLIPPYIIKQNEINQALEIIESSLKTVRNSNFSHKGFICNYLDCGNRHR